MCTRRLEPPNNGVVEDDIYGDWLCRIDDISLYVSTEVRGRVGWLLGCSGGRQGAKDEKDSNEVPLEF
jgi:hypothetical protein